MGMKEYREAVKAISEQMRYLTSQGVAALAAEFYGFLALAAAPLK
jgi:hypothetical protein